MRKQCIYCPNDYWQPSIGFPQSPYGVCPDCERKLAEARELGPGAEALLELQAQVEQPVAVRKR